VKATIKQIHNKNYEQQQMIICNSKLVILYKCLSLFIVSILFNSIINICKHILSLYL